MTAATRLVGVAAVTPPWRPWVERVEAALREDARRTWDRATVCVGDPAGPGAPLLDGAVVAVPTDLLGDDVDGRALQLESAIAQECDADAELVALPLLRACSRGLAAALPSAWSFGHCPLCGAWPTFAESRGAERARRLRCARCATDWAYPSNRCVFCDETDATQRAMLIAEDLPGRCADACRTCRGYLKTSPTSSPIASEDLHAEDVATIALDAAAIELAYRRPAPCPQIARVLVIARS
jgi:FdhE protein